MTHVSTRRVVVGVALVLISVASAPAAILYLGLPNGHVGAYTTRDARFPWLRVASADLPDVGGHAMATLADLDGDGDGRRPHRHGRRRRGGVPQRGNRAPRRPGSDDPTGTCRPVRAAHPRSATSTVMATPICSSAMRTAA